MIEINVYLNSLFILISTKTICFLKSRQLFMLNHLVFVFNKKKNKNVKTNSIILI